MIAIAVQELIPAIDRADVMFDVAQQRGRIVDEQVRVEPFQIGDELKVGSHPCQLIGVAYGAARVLLAPQKLIQEFTGGRRPPLMQLRGSGKVGLSMTNTTRLPAFSSCCIARL